MEIFPPKKDSEFSSAFRVAKELSEINPDFISVTYGAGGSRSKNTIEIASYIQNELHIPAMAHLTCVGSTQADINRLCGEFKKYNISNVLALRGDRPKDMSDEIIAAIAAHPNICRHIHLPVQSGSNKVLAAMNRKYTREWYLDRISAIRRAIPDCGITSDLFTGFHDETEEDFQETLDLMRTVGFDASFMFKYSERPGTLASRQMPDNVPEEVKIERLNRMIALQNELSAASNIRDRGHVFEVLVEGVAKRSHEQMVGRTSQNKTAVFPRGNAKVGEFVKVRVLDSSSATLICELAD